MRKLLLLSFLTACQVAPKDTTPSTQQTIDAGAQDTKPAVTFYRDVKPIIDQQCTQCHAENTAGPIDFTIPEVVQSWAAVIEEQIMAGTMPPWHAAESCNDYLDIRKLTEEEKGTIQEWNTLNAPLGDPNDIHSEARTPEGLSGIDRELKIEGPHTPEGIDDYRCFAMQWPETTIKYITGYEVRPTNPAIVHHVNIFIIDPSLADAQLTKQRRSNKPGYECFGGQFDAGTALLGSWVPGLTQRDFPKDSGILIKPGSIIMMEMHFNTDSGNTAPDESRLALKLADTVQKRAMIAAFWDFETWNGSGGMMIPANAESTTHTYQLDPKNILGRVAPWITGDKLTIHAAGLHMHYLGKKARLEVKKYSGATACLIEIPSWDFDWQSSYFLKEPITFDIGKDKLFLECEWDNSQNNQPDVNGDQRPSRDVFWGPDSTDEMCIGLFYVTE